MQLTNGPLTLGHSCDTENRLEEAIRKGVRLSISLGAGLDKFAYRRPGWSNGLQVLEFDHLATPAIKRDRVTTVAWDHPSNLHFVPVDFTRESRPNALERSPYDPTQLSFFSWLGVSFCGTP